MVGPVKDATFVEPTGAGDAFRSGFLAATAWGLPIERAIQLGNLMAVHVLETVGPQEYDLTAATLADRAKHFLRRGGRRRHRRPPPGLDAAARQRIPRTETDLLRAGYLLFKPVIPNGFVLRVPGPAPDPVAPRRSTTGGSFAVWPRSRPLTAAHPS